MVRIIGLIAGLYLVLACIATVGAAYGVATGQGPDYSCETNDLAITAGTAPPGTSGSTNPVAVLARRFLLWPLTLADAMGGGYGVPEWFMLNYPHAPEACLWGGDAPRANASNAERPAG